MSLAKFIFGPQGRRQLGETSSNARLLGDLLILSWRSSPASAIALLAITAVLAGIPILIAWTTKSILDTITSVNPKAGTTEALVLFILLYALGRLIGGTVPAIFRFTHSEYGRKLTFIVEQSIYQQISRFEGIQYFEDSAFHDMLRLGSQGATTASTDFIRLAGSIPKNVLTLLGFAGVFALIDAGFLWVIGLSAIPQIIVHSKLAAQRFELASEISIDERRGFYYRSLLASAPSASEIRLFGLSDYFLDKLISTIKYIHDQHKIQDRSLLKGSTFLESAASIINICLFAFIVLEAVEGEISIGDVVLFSAGILGIQNALAQLAYDVSRLREHLLFLRPYQRLMQLPSPIYLSPTPVQIPRLTHGIEFEDVRFRYSGNAPEVLKGVNLFVAANELTAIVGRNGAGKSTLVKLLTRLYDPTHGRILWNGIDIREFDIDEYRSQIGAVLQDFVRYDLSVSENIGLGNRQKAKNSELIRWAAKRVDLHEEIMQLPEGYETILSRWLVDPGRGSQLSEGQWQRIALARMYVRNAAFEIFDEPTASLDPQAEYEFISKFVQRGGFATALLISHRLNSVKMADSIVVIENGIVTEEGSHLDLVSLGKTYAGMFLLQAEQYR